MNPKDYDKPLPEVICDMTDGLGVDYSLEAVGMPFTMKQSLLCTKVNGGSSCIIGVAAAGETIKLLGEEAIGRDWCGTAFGGAKSRDQVPEYVDMYMKGEIKVDEFITHGFPLKDIMKAFHVMHEGTCIRAVIDMFA